MAVEIRLRKKYNNFALDVQFKTESKRIGILGASGCGKSMTLRGIAGVQHVDEGYVKVGEEILFDSSNRINRKPQKRHVGYLFQNYALFPTMTVAENVMAGLHGSKAENQKRMKMMLQRFQLEKVERNLPEELSGGQQQRVALARIMAYQPEVILVSHNRDEIYRFSDELFIMEEGKVLCQGKTKEVFLNPRLKTAARLTGCKNIAAIERKDTQTFEVPDWRGVVHCKKPIPEHAAYIGYRAHEFCPIWGNEIENCIPFQLKSAAELPFEKKYFAQGNNGEEICWFVQRDQWKTLEKKGFPDYLQIVEEHILFLED